MTSDYYPPEYSSDFCGDYPPGTELHDCENCADSYECMGYDTDDCFCSSMCPACEYIYDKEMAR